MRDHLDSGRFQSDYSIVKNLQRVSPADVAGSLRMDGLKTKLYPHRLDLIQPGKQPNHRLFQTVRSGADGYGTDIRVLDAMNFSYINTIKGPIAIQHGYGDGAEISDEATVNAVSNLLYSTPVYRYAAMNMSAIETINDAVGGVQVEILEDMTIISI